MATEKDCNIYLSLLASNIILHLYLDALLKVVDIMESEKE
jgi:hypothetical protein